MPISSASPVLPLKLGPFLRAFTAMPFRKSLWLLALVPMIPARAQVQTIWQVGKFDESPVEFSRHASDSVTFRTDSSDPAKDWPASQETGSTYRILFPLDSVGGPYVLKVAALIDQPRIPALQIGINGHSGKFFLHPKLSYSRSDFSYAFDPHESQSTVQIDIPATFLKKGENTLSIACVDDPPTSAGQRKSAVSATTPSNSWKSRARSREVPARLARMWSLHFFTGRVEPG